MRNLILIPTPELDLVWPEVVDFIEKGNRMGQGEMTVDQIRLLLVQGTYKLLVSVEDDKPKAALVIQITSYPMYRCVTIITLGGTDLGMTESDVEQLKTICKSFGATKMQGLTHEKMTHYLSKFGFEKKYDVIRMDI